MSSIPSVTTQGAERAIGRVFELDPLRDPRWSAFIEEHPDATPFHTVGWLQALRNTYGYEPCAITTSSPDEPLSNGLVVCRVRSWITGSRLVSLPFSDHCRALVSESQELQNLVEHLRRDVDSGRVRYFEMRPLHLCESNVPPQMQVSADGDYVLHRLDLRPELDQIYRKFHKSCVQRKITKAEKEGLTYEEGRSEELITKFYGLMLRTRRRHQLPPQSRAWFHNLALCMGDSIKFRVVSKGTIPVAAIVTIHHPRCVIYKYGSSDVAFNNLGGMFLLMWRAIRDAKVSGAECFDFGRSDRTNEGLVNFKDHWGATKSSLTYRRYPSSGNTQYDSGWKLWFVQKTCTFLPDPLFEKLGSVLYRHIG